MKRSIQGAIVLLVVLVLGIAAYTLFIPLGSQIINSISVALGNAPTDATKTSFKAPPMPTPTPTPSPTPTPTIVPTPTLTPLQTIQAKGAYVLNATNNKEIININGQVQLPMASTTKIMTALVALRNGNPDQLITVQQDAIDRVNELGQLSASSAQLVVGDTLKLKDLLYGLLLPSGADAAVAIADAIGGSTDHFIAMMNATAQNLGLTQTHYTSVDGLTDDDGQHYTTASDMSHLAQVAMTYPLFAQIVVTQSYNVPPTSSHHAYPWNTTNSFLTEYVGALGVKTGHTDAAQWCLVFAAKRDGKYLIGAVLGDTTLAQRDQDATTLLDEGFKLL